MSIEDTRFMKACRRELADTTPVWFMRQAGRMLPEYREIRERYTLMEVCRQPELCAEVTMQPVRRLGVDAAVMFADIMLPLIGIGVGVELVESVGPVVAHPIRSMDDLDVLRPIEPEEDVPFVMEAVRIVKREVGDATPLIGFCGAPFTLASYLIEGKPSRDFSNTKATMYRDPALWHGLMERLTSIMITYLRAKVEAGVDALQLFDSWVGALSPRDYAEYVQPYSRRHPARAKATGHSARDPVHPFRHQHGHPARPDKGRRRQHYWRRLAHPPGHRLGAHRLPPRHPGQPRCRRDVRPTKLLARARPGRAATGRGQTRPHLQPGPRRPARPPAGQRGASGRVCARARGGLSCVVVGCQLSVDDGRKTKTQKVIPTTDN